MDNEEVKDLFCKPIDERALLYCSLERTDNFYSICSKMDENDFLVHEHKMIYILMKNILQKGVEKFDVSLITSKAEAEGVLEMIGGYEYIESISRMHVDKTNFDVYLNNVIEASTKYKLYNDLDHSIKNLTENAKSDVDSEELMASVEARIMDLSTKSKSIKEARDLGDGLEEYIEQKRDNPVEMSGISTGYTILDHQIDGLVPGTLTVISARKKEGKSTFLSNIAAHIAYRLRIPVLYVDTEMSFNEWRDRVLAMLTGVDERVIKHGGYSKEDYNKIKQGIEVVKKGRLFHQRMPGYSVDKITALYKKYKLKEDIGVGVFDYLKEPDSTSLDRRRAEWQVLGDVTTRIKDLAGELEIPFVTAVQINREGEVAGSDRISWYADIIMQWMKKKKEELEDYPGPQTGSHKLVIRDTRRGGATPEEGIWYKFRKRSLNIREVPAEYQKIDYSNEVVNDASDDDEEELI